MIQEVRLKPTREGRGKPPPDPIGKLMQHVPTAVDMAVRMAFSGRSTSRGRRPQWLRDMADARFVDAIAGEETVVRFEAPRLGEAAGAVYDQLQLWRTRPDAEDTGFDLLGDVIAELEREHSDSELLDPPMLQELGRFGQVVNGHFSEMHVTGRRYTARRPAVVTPKTIATAREFHAATPGSVRARVVGTLDMIRASSDSFALRLDDGAEVRGQLIQGDIRSLRELLSERVLVLGTALFRASGSLLRVDAESIAIAGKQAPLWSSLPQPRERRSTPAQYRQPQGPKSGLAAIIGKWPGDETDEEIEAALRHGF